MACLARAGPSRLPALSLTTARSLSTSTPVQAAVTNKRKELITTARTRQKLSIKGKPTVRAAGMGGRITLSYTGASPPPDLSGLPLQHPETVQERSIGTPTRFTDRAFGVLKEFGLPRRIEQQMTRGGGPAFVIRDKTVQAVRMLEMAKSEASDKHRYLMTGDRGAGKSAVLLQAVHHAVETDWLVLYIPRIEALVGSKSRFAYSPEEQIFVQPDLSNDLLQRFLKANQRILQTLDFPAQPNVPGLPSDQCKLENAKDMLNLIEFVRRTPEFAPSVLRSVLKAVASQKQVPMLLAVDEAQGLFGFTKYRDPQYLPVEAYHLSVPLLVLDYLTGKESFANGCVLTSISHSTTGAHQLPKAIVLAFDLPSPGDISGYARVNDVHLQHALSGIQRWELGNSMTPQEAAGLYKISQMKGWARRDSDEAFLNVLHSSAGNPAQLLKAMNYDFNLQPLQQHDGTSTLS